MYAVAWHVVNTYVLIASLGCLVVFGVLVAVCAALQRPL